MVFQIDTYIGNITNAISAVTTGIDKTTNGVPLGGFVKGILHQASGKYDIAPNLVGSLVGDFAGNLGAVERSDAEPAALIV